MSSITESIHAQMSWDCVPNASECWCRGSGWISSDWDSWHKCPYHYEGQPNNESDEEEWEYWDGLQSNEQFLVIPGNWYIEWQQDAYLYNLKELASDDIPF